MDVLLPVLAWSPWHSEWRTCVLEGFPGAQDLLGRKRGAKYKVRRSSDSPVVGSCGENLNSW